MQDHTADGTRISNLGQKTFEAVSEHGSALSQTFQIADISRPLTSVGEFGGCGQCGGVRSERWLCSHVDSGRRLDFKREHGVHLLRTWLQERAKPGFLVGSV